MRLITYATIHSNISPLISSLLPSFHSLLPILTQSRTIPPPLSPQTLRSLTHKSVHQYPPSPLLPMYPLFPFSLTPLRQRFPTNKIQYFISKQNNRQNAVLPTVQNARQIGIFVIILRTWSEVCRLISLKNAPGLRCVASFH